MNAVYLYIICIPFFHSPIPPSVNSAISLFVILVCSMLVPQWFVEISAKKWMQAEQVTSLVLNIVLCVKFIYTGKVPFVCVVKES